MNSTGVKVLKYHKGKVNYTYIYILYSIYSIWVDRFIIKSYIQHLFVCLFLIQLLIK